MDPIYLDYNATTPIDPQVAEAMLPYIHQRYGNPSSSHLPGVAAKEAVENARSQLADMLGSKAEEVIFTSGGTESNNHAIKGVVGAYRDKGNHIITSAVEHPAVLEVCRYLEGQGCGVTYLPVDEFGMVDPQHVATAITPKTILVTIMHANNEVGTIEPLEEISRITRERGVLLHADCAQSVGKIPVRVDELGVDLLSIAGHKVYAPKGIGALYIRTGVRLEKLMHGASHEMGWRAGTENVIEIVGLGRACELVKNNLVDYHRHMQTMRDRLEAGIGERFERIRFNGHPKKRLPNTLSASFRGMEANVILEKLEGVYASAGAACHSDHVEVSSVLEAMKVPLEYAMGTLRFSVGRYTTEQEIDQALLEITRAVRQ
ncbi:MAG: cysteine desulfurase NifS [SAR202 cluster bacterium Io17-Chloro-G6]|nr:MAG: cysteine desulfurase NifS [SAR202 cluster bacterium Io17-Chloro-G6]